jgi:hypothetical protein
MEVLSILKIGPLNTVPLGLCLLETVIIATHCQLFWGRKL